MGSLLAQVTRGVVRVPDRITLHGLDGLGKSTFGSQAPAPIFLGPERGTASLNVARFEKVSNLAQVFAAVTELTNDPHEFKTLVVDSWDWIEPLIWDYVCQQEGVPNIEIVGGGYGKGYIAALKYWRQLLNALDLLQEKRGMGVIGICHSDLKTVNSPMSANPYDRYIIKMHAKAAGLLREWSEVVLFASKKIITKGRPNQKGRAISDGTSYMYSRWSPSYDAKTRYAIPEELPLRYEAYRNAVDASDTDKAKLLLEEIHELLAQCSDEELKKKAQDFLETTKANDVLALTKINDRLRELLVGKEEK